MERFELTIVAQGSHSIWIALLAVALLCMSQALRWLVALSRVDPQASAQGLPVSAWTFSKKGHSPVRTCVVERNAG
jgi:hypothetical protein